MHLCHPGQLQGKRQEIIWLPLQAAFLFSVQTTYCPRSPANSREQTDNAAAINKAALLHIHINQTCNSTTFFLQKKRQCFTGAMEEAVRWDGVGDAFHQHWQNLLPSCFFPWEFLH